MAAEAAWAQTQIGGVVEVQVDAYGQIPNRDRTQLRSADDVFADQLVETVDGGGLRLRFADASELSLGSGARVALDRFVYDPNGASGGVLALGAGTMRFISGTVGQDSNLSIETPTATIGIRGTDLIVSVRRDGATVVGTVDGLVRVTPRNGGAGADIGPGFLAIVDESTESVEALQAPFGPDDEAALADWFTTDEFVAEAGERFGTDTPSDADDDALDAEDDDAEDDDDDDDDDDDSGDDDSGDDSGGGDDGGGDGGDGGE
ncbi:MAG: FecR domain-containing protein [Alphaproteobacteria bacterium]